MSTYNTAFSFYFPICFGGCTICRTCVYNRLFHYPKDRGGMKPNELSPFVGPKSKISEKLDQN